MRKRITAVFIMMTIMMLLYAVSAIMQNGIWGDILAPLATLGPSVVLLILFVKEKKSRSIWLFAALATITWCLTDALWGVYSLVLGWDPGESLLIAALYFLPNLFLCLTTGYLLMSGHKKWNRLQRILDLLVTTFIGLTSIWVILLKSQFEMLASMDAWSLITFIYAVTDVFCIGCVILWALNIGDSKVSKAMVVFIAGILMYNICDLVYDYQFLQGTYVANTMIDVIYIGSFFVISCGALWHRWYPVDLVFHTPTELPEKNNYLSRSLILALIPILMKAVQIISWSEFFGLIVILVLYQIFSTYIASVRINAKLLQHEKSMNKMLEEQIDIRTKELLEINKNLETVSNHDMITNFYNRRYFMTQLDHMLKQTPETEQVALLFADVDRFKAINDTFGHDIGDQVLVEIANRMTLWNMYGATMARLGGDEFVIAIRGIESSEQIAEIAQELITRCNESIFLATYHFHITISIGITLYPIDARDPIAMLKNADIAMYHAKSQGCNQLSFFSSMIKEQVTRKSELEMLLRYADFNSEFFLRYQPQFSTQTEELVGFEAFLNWNSPGVGLVKPSEFIQIAEETGLIIPISEWVIQEAVDQICIWNKRVDKHLRMSINISSKQLDTVHFIPFIENLIARSDIDPKCLGFEIVENFAMSGSGQTMTIMQTLHDLGVNIIIDNFGIGYSSLSYLKKYAIDSLKIARPLTENIDSDQNDYQIVKATIMMAQAMGIKTVAAVETPKQLRVLAELGCDEVQGYLFGHPMVAGDIEAAFLND